MTNLEVLPVDEFYGLRNKWRNKTEFEYEYQKDSFKFSMRGRTSYHFTPGDSMDFLVVFDIMYGCCGTGWAVLYDKEEIQEYDSLFTYLEPRIKEHLPDFQIVSERQLCLF